MDVTYKCGDELYRVNQGSFAANQLPNPGQVNFPSHLHNVDTLLTNFS